MKLNPFKKNTDKKEKIDLFKEVEKKTESRIAEIEKLNDPAERVAQYEALGDSLLKFYDDGKPVIADIEGSAAFPVAVTVGPVVGTGAIIGGIALAPIVPYVGIPLAIGGIFGGVAGGIGLGSLVGGRHNRKEIRAEYGSVMNAKRMYKLQQDVKKKAEKDRKIVLALEQSAEWQEKKAALREHLDKTFNPPAAAPEARPDVLKAASPRVIRTQAAPGN